MEAGTITKNVGIFEEKVTKGLLLLVIQGKIIKGKISRVNLGRVDRFLKGQPVGVLVKYLYMANSTYRLRGMRQGHNNKGD